MSDDLYTRRVVWEGLRKRGFAKVHEVSVRLSEPPKLIAKFMDLWFTPEIGEYAIRDDCHHPRRDMNNDERRAVEVWLDNLLRAVRGYLT